MGIEEFRTVVGFPLYEVSDHGTVRRKVGGMGATAGRALRPSLSRGYPFVCLRRGNVTYARQIHRMVAEAFIPNPDGLPEVMHADNIKTNIHVSNLSWGTHAQNVADAARDGLMNVPKRKRA